MKRYYFLLAVLLFAMTLSCAKEEKTLNEETGPQEQILSDVKTETRTFSMVFSPDTKVSIDGTGKTGWEIGDNILIHGEYINKVGHSVVVNLDGVTNTISADKKTAYITVTTTEKDDPVVEGCVRKYSRDDYLSSIYAVYPAEAVTDAETRSYYFNVFKNTNAPIMIGYDSGDTFVFRNYCGIISFVMPDSQDFDSYVFSGNNDEIVGYSNYVARHAMGTTELKKDQGVNSSGLYTTGGLTSITGIVECDASKVNLICIPTGTSVSFEKGFTIKFIKAGAIVKKVSTRSTFSLTRNDYMPLGDISGHLKDYEAIPALEKDKAVDMSESVSANCYVVNGGDSLNESKVFKFRAVKGNSYVKDSAVGTSVGTVASVEILWETWNNASSVTPNSVISAVDFKDDFVYFKMPAALHAGNAVIAAKDASSNILWSWHIWVPETAITTGTYGISTPAMMDRNLGALSAATWGTDNIGTMGLLYQWGRKDPFLNKKDHSSSSNDYTNHAVLSGSSVVTTMQMSSITESIQKPTTFAAQSEDKTSWLATEEVDMWQSTKTIYDPCPPGYKVPVQSESVLFTNNITDTSVYSGWQISTANCQFAVGLSDNYTVFPTGFLYYNGRYDEPHNKAVVWSASYSDTYRATCLHVKLSDGSYSQYKRSIASGASVRCVAE